jgi:hypothetical protein
MNRYHHRLNIPVIFQPEFPVNNNSAIFSYSKSQINKELINWLSDMSVGIKHCEVFYLSPESQSNHIIHLDGELFDDHVKLNFAYCETEELMNWFIPKENAVLISKKTPIDTKYIEADKDQCILVHRAIIGQPSLINAGQLHSVSDVKSPRYCFSFVLSKIKTNKYLTWDDAVEIFKDYIEREHSDGI